MTGSLFRITVAICTRNPDRGRLSRVFSGLAGQDLPAQEWDLLLIDNGSSPPLEAPALPVPVPVRLLPEPQAGLFHARLTAIRANQSELLVFIDDDTVPAPGFLRALREAFSRDERLSAAGPRIMAEYLSPPPDWLREFEWALAIRNLGPDALSWSLADGLPMPHFTPIGAGLALRAAHLAVYVSHATTYEEEILRRSWIGQGRGGNEDKDLVYTLLRAGGRVAYVPDAVLTHLIPPERTTSEYLERLLPGLAWLRLRNLRAHGLDDHAPITRLGCLIRTVRAWFRHRAWRRPVPRLRWLSARGIFRARADNLNDSFRYHA